MDLNTILLIAAGWFAVALVVSVAFGSFIYHVKDAPDEEEMADHASKLKVVRYMRRRKGSQNTEANADAVAEQRPAVRRRTV